jgi:hypothetical protein
VIPRDRLSAVQRLRVVPQWSLFAATACIVVERNEIASVRPNALNHRL